MHKIYHQKLPVRPTGVFVQGVQAAALLPAQSSSMILCNCTTAQGALSTILTILSGTVIVNSTVPQRLALRVQSSVTDVIVYHLVETGSSCRLRHCKLGPQTTNREFLHWATAPKTYVIPSYICADVCMYKDFVNYHKAYYSCMSINSSCYTK